jgi:predicted MPP superfamily phosphohydrolase
MAVGPFAIGGIDGRIYGSTDAWQAAGRRVYAALGRTPGIKILVAHRPDEFVPAPSFVTLVLAGHTHCGQIALPIIGPLVTGSDYGRKYACGVFREGSKVLVVTGGVGTSHIPLRIGAPPDIWLISIGGPASHG